MSVYLGGVEVGFAIPVSNNNDNDDDNNNQQQQNENLSWVRPSDWPDLDSLIIEVDSFEGVYLTCDNRTNVAIKKIGIKVEQHSMGYYVESGYIANQEFVGLTGIYSEDPYLYYDYSDTFNNFNDENINTDYVVIKITPSNANNHFTNLNFIQLAQSTTGGVTYLSCYYMPCLERRGNLPYYNRQVSSSTESFCTGKMQYDNTAIGSEIVLDSLYKLYANAFNLQEINFSNWSTTIWSITDLSYMFQNCYSLKKIDLSSWDTSNWAVTTMRSMFQDCNNLVELNMNTLDTSNWAVTTLQYTWSGCNHLKELNLNSLDTSNWELETLYYTWTNCWNLKKLQIKDWNVTKFNITSFYYTWAYCYSLKEIEAFSWINTQQWATTTLYAMCRDCYVLEKIDFSNWNISNSSIAIGNFAINCYALKTLKLSTLIGSQITSNSAAITTKCYALETIILPNNWKKVENFSECYSLSRTSLLSIFNAMADNTGGSAITITLGDKKGELIDADILILTNKGYTVT